MEVMPVPETVAAVLVRITLVADRGGTTFSNGVMLT
ncbi:unnamed protein product, partial [Didymodactylos carnosus]